MKQILQNLKTGETLLADVPCPKPTKGELLIQTNKTLVSVGTERMLVDFGKANFLEKARQQPDKVKMVLSKVKTDGLKATIDTVMSKLDQPLPLGYCNVGQIINSSVEGFERGQRVVSNGNHAEVVRVPKNLCAIIPDNVDDESAAFTVIGAIALQGIRLVKPTIGETFVVTGLGLIGLITVQILKANGCRVIGIDFDSTKCELARQFGAETVDLSKGEDPIGVAKAYSRGRGVDGVIITASTKSNEPVSQAANMCRKRGRIVLVGVVGLELSRADFYEKELSFQVSCSYGPGRYDVEYEQKGKDYPEAFVRWTEQRNFEAVLDLMSSGALDVKTLITHRYEIEQATDAYLELDNKAALGILLNYSQDNLDVLTDPKVELPVSTKVSTGAVSVVGAGNYASRVLIPMFAREGANFSTLVTSGGVTAVHHGKKNEFKSASTDFNDALGTETSTVVIATRHDLHAQQTIQALKAGKNVFVEKPLSLTLDEVGEVEEAYKLSDGAQLMVGYNRRFSPHIQAIKKQLENQSWPKTFIMTMNAGEIPADHWTQDPEIGGGRIIGEACHYIDLMRFLADSPIKQFQVMKMGDTPGVDICEDKAIINLSFEDGSIGTIQYFANGGKDFPKERIEVFCGGGIIQVENFLKTNAYNWNGFKGFKSKGQDKGQAECVRQFLNSAKSGSECPIPVNEIFEVAKISIQIAEELRSN